MWGGIRKSIPNYICQYDIANDKWVVLKDQLPEKMGILDCGIFTFQDKAYIVAEKFLVTYASATKKLQIHTTELHLPHFMFVFNSQPYYLVHAASSGFNLYQFDINSYTLSNKVSFYLPTGSAWSSKARTDLDFYHFFVIGDYLYVIGQKAVYQFDLKAPKNIKIMDDFPLGDIIKNYVSFVIDSKAYLGLGEDDLKNNSRTLYAFDPGQAAGKQ